MNASATKTIHQRPALIQALQWDQVLYTEAAAKYGSIRGIRFDFYNGELFKLAVTYDPAGTDGLTTADMIEAISAVYGPAATPQRTIALSPSALYDEKQEVLACWEDALYSYNLFRSEYGNTFGLVALSKEVAVMATNASREADRLDKLEAPAKELARQAKQEEEKRAAQEKARLVSKPKFRP